MPSTGSIKIDAPVHIKLEDILQMTPKELEEHDEIEILVEQPEEG